MLIKNKFGPSTLETKGGNFLPDKIQSLNEKNVCNFSKTTNVK